MDADPITSPPTLAGFQAWAAMVMGLSPTVIAPNDPGYAYAFQVATDLVPQTLMAIPDLYTLAVYNFAGSQLLQFQNDLPNSTFFADARKGYGINSFTPGVITESHDVSSGQTMAVGKGLQNLDVLSLQLLKNPYGRQALMLMQTTGTLWGIS